MGGRHALGLVFGVLFLGLALWGVPLRELGGVLAATSPLLLLQAAAVFLVAQALRALRQLLLVRPLAPQASFGGQHAIVCMSFFCIATFPAHLGELVRPYLLREKAGVALGAGFGVVLVERVLELTGLFVALVAVLLLVDLPPGVVEIAGTPVDLAGLGRRLALTLLPPAIGGLVVLVVWGRELVGVLERGVDALERRLRVRWPRRLAGLLLGFAASFVTGLGALRRPAHLAGVLVLTAAGFLASGLVALYLARAVGLAAEVGFGEALGVTCVTMLGTALPAPPGQVGVFEGSARAGLALFGVGGETFAARALAFALVAHWWIFAVQSATALWFFWRDRVSLLGSFRFARSRDRARANPDGSPASKE